MKWTRQRCPYCIKLFSYEEPENIGSLEDFQDIITDHIEQEHGFKLFKEMDDGYKLY